MPKISLIIPAYNVAPWLAGCLDSLVGQSLQNWEAIVIDDASTDDSASIAAKYASLHHRIKLIKHEQNKGLGASRNTGCAAAQGKFLYFLDGDDMLPSCALQDMYGLAIANDADLIIGDFYEFQDGQNAIDTSKYFPAGDGFLQILGDNERPFAWRDKQDDYALLMPSIYSTTCCGKLFKRDLWRALDCHVPNDLRMAEDFIPVKKFFFSARSIVPYQGASLLYRKRRGSATTKRSKKAMEIIRAYPYAIEMFNDIGLYDKLRPYIERFFIQTFISHVGRFLPLPLWWRFYKKSAPLIKEMQYPKSHPKLDGVDLIAWQKGSVYGFITIIFSFLPYVQGMKRLWIRIIGKSGRVLKTILEHQD